jgi:hypothetical protein
MTNTTVAKWRALIAAQEKSGMTVRAFAESRGITPTTMCWWRSRPGRRMAFTGHAGAGPGDGVGLRDRGMLPDDGLDSLFACSTAPSTGTVLVTALRAEQRPACPTTCQMTVAPGPQGLGALSFLEGA